VLHAFLKEANPLLDSLNGAEIENYTAPWWEKKALAEIFSSTATTVSDKCGSRFPYAAGYSTDIHLTPVCKFVGKYSDEYWFDLMNQYYGLGDLLFGVSMVTIFVYFVTSSDSGSLVVDLIASNGEEAHWISRVYWCCTEGMLAIALLIAGGNKALRALQAVSIIGGVPLTGFCCLICSSLWRTCQLDAGEIVEGQYNPWKMQLWGGIFDFMEWAFSLGKSGLPPKKRVTGFFLGTFVPPFCLIQGLKLMPGKTGLTRQDFGVCVLSVITWVGFVGLAVAKGIAPETGVGGLEFWFYLSFCCTLAFGRVQIREAFKIEGGSMRDYLCAFFVYNQCAYQLMVQSEEGEKPSSTNEPDAEKVGAPANL